MVVVLLWWLSSWWWLHTCNSRPSQGAHSTPSPPHVHSGTREGSTRIDGHTLLPVRKPSPRGGAVLAWGEGGEKRVVGGGRGENGDLLETDHHGTL